MSKIIKASEELSVTEYGFRALERERSGESFRNFPATGSFVGWNGKKEDDFSSSAVFDEVEAAIQARLFEVERKAQEIEKEAYEKGYAQGEKDGFDFGKKSMLIVKERLEKLTARLEAIPERVFKDYRDWFISTCMAVTKKLVAMELEAKPQAFTRWVDSVLDDADAHHSLTLYLHPKDVELLAKGIDLEKWTRDAKHPFLIKTDGKLDRGGCRVESDIQCLDASFETRFSQLEQALRHDESTGRE